MDQQHAPRPAAHRRAPSPGRRLRRRVLLGVSAVAALALVGGGVAVARTVVDLDTGIHRSDIHLPVAGASASSSAVPQAEGESNILVMGLDSRRDEDGNVLPAATYQALHAGDGSDGGYNTNVLMLIHIPAGGGPAVGISIPRDDWTTLPGAPDGNAEGKIKQAYGYELDQTLRHIVNTEPGVSHDDAYQQARSAARQEEITTVSQFLGGVPINHFIEVTMAAFYDIAQAVQPIQVCLNETTSDTYSGADFHKGLQSLDAAQALSFVRQRRDTSGSGVELTDLDRERREQAFIVALAYKLRHEDVLTNFPLVQHLIDTAKQDIALDSGFDLLSFAGDAQRFAGGGITFQTLPIVRYGVEDGQDVNIVDLAQVRSTTAALIAASDHPAAAQSATPSTAATPSTGAAQGTAGTGSAAGQGAAGQGAAGQGAGAAQGAPTTSGVPSTTTTSAAQPLASGGIPCVN